MKETLEVAAQMETIKIILVVFGSALLVLGGIALQLIRNAREAKRELNERIARRESAEAERSRASQESDAKRNEAFLGLFSQLASQSETMLSVHQQTMNVLEKTEGGRAALVDVLNRYAETLEKYSSVLQNFGVELKTSNQINSDQAAKLQVNTDALRDAAESGKATIAQLRKDLIMDATNWVAGIKAELGGDRAIIAGLPERFARLERAMTDIQSKIGEMPLAVAAKITDDIHAVRELTTAMAEKINSMSVRIEGLVKEKEGQNGKVEVTQILAGTGSNPGAGSSAGNP